MFERTALPDGPRVISARMPGMRSLSVAVYVMAGSRGEVREKSGLAHFMEHITFKGTRDLVTTRDVSEAIEGVGGNSNAATDREVTVYWARLPVREAELGVHVLAELTLRPRLRSADIAHEREIIVDEINSYRDDPAQYIYNVWDEAFFGDSPLGWEIAGDEASVRGLSDTDIRDFWAAAYRPANMVVALAGDIGHDGPWTWSSGRSAAAMEPRRPTCRRCRVRSSSCGWSSATRPRPTSPSACPASRATMPTSGRWTCSTRCWVTAPRRGCS